MVRKGCKYFKACGNAENCRNCDGYEKVSIVRSYMVDGGAYHRLYFETEWEANGYRNEVLRKTGEVLGVFASSHKVNATYGG